MRTFYHRGSMGDIIYSIPTIIALGGGDLYLGKENQYNFLKSLLEKQSCISYVSIAKPKLKIDFNLDEYRPVHRNNLKKHLCFCHLEPFNVSYDLSSSWIENIEAKKINKIIVTTTPRYRDIKRMEWEYLNERIKDCTYVGLPNEYQAFKREYKLNDLDFNKPSSALEMASIIKGSNVFLGNQTLALAIAEGMKHPRIYERCEEKDNCRPFGRNGFFDNIHILNEFV